jgi:RimJ/RimL family protein N-acetyltransferase
MGGEVSEAAVVDAVKNWEYQTDRALIVPYVPSEPSYKFPEEFLAGLYLQTRNEGLLRRTFPGQGDQHKYSMNWFISYFYGRTMIIPMIKPGEVTGFAWMYDMDVGNFRKGSVGVCFFRKYWGDDIITDLARLGLKWFFKELGLYTIYGTIAGWNRVSMRFGKRLGFEPCGCLPRFFLNPDGSVSDNHLVVLKREEFLGRT